MAEGRQIRAGLERSKQIRGVRSQLKTDSGMQSVPERKNGSIEVVDRAVTRISNEEAREALKIAEGGYEGFAENEDDLN